MTTAVPPRLPHPVDPAIVTSSLTTIAPTHQLPLPSSALMALVILGLIAAFARFPGHKRKR